MATLYLSMADAVIKHWRANSNAYPKKFILTPAQHQEFVNSRRMGKEAGVVIDGTSFMGVSIEQSETTPGVLVAIDDAEISLQ